MCRTDCTLVRTLRNQIELFSKKINNFVLYIYTYRFQLCNYKIIKISYEQNNFKLNNWPKLYTNIISFIYSFSSTYPCLHNQKLKTIICINFQFFCRSTLFSSSNWSWQLTKFVRVFEILYISKFFCIFFKLFCLLVTHFLGKIS